jgi:hypothetical protein
MPLLTVDLSAVPEDCGGGDAGPRSGAGFSGVEVMLPKSKPW